MNSIETEEHIRRLNFMLGTLGPRDHVPYVPKSKEVAEPEFVVERYVTTLDGKMQVEHPQRQA